MIGKHATLIVLLFLSLTLLGQNRELEVRALDLNEAKILEFDTGVDFSNKRIAFLGSQGQGFEQMFDAQFALFKALHKKYGYETLAIEADAFDVYHANKAKDRREQLKGVFPLEMRSWHQMDSLLDYIEQNDIKLLGLRHYSDERETFIDELLLLIERNHIHTAVDNEILAIVLDGILLDNTIDESELSYKKYREAIQRVVKELEKMHASQEGFYWRVFLHNLLTFSGQVQQSEVCIEADDYINAGENVNEAEMAYNLLEYAKKYPTQKIVALGDLSHAIKVNESQSYIGKDFVSAAMIVKQTLQDQIASIALIHAYDKFFEPSQQNWFDAPILKGSFEDELKQVAKGNNLWVSAKQNQLLESRQTRLLHRNQFEKLTLANFFDAYVYMEVKQPTTSLELSSWEPISVELPETTKAIEPKLIVDSQVVKGRLLDAHTKLPVAYASVFVANTDLYRVSDEQGYFELALRDKSKTASVFIDALGYEFMEIELDKVSQEILVTPNDHLMDEIVIVGNLTPEQVLKRAIDLKGINHPTTPYNVTRYGNYIYRENDQALVDVEYSLKEYDKGYATLRRVTNSVEQIKWNIDKLNKAVKYVSQLEGHRENAIKYSSLLNKRKYKQYKFEFVESSDPALAHLYILSFQTHKQKWNYTNRNFPNVYTGRIYINRENFAIEKVVEQWEATLEGDEVESLVRKDYSYYEAKRNKAVKVVIKEESVCEFTYDQGLGLYVASKFYDRDFMLMIGADNKEYTVFVQRDNYLLDPQNKEVEEMLYEGYIKDKDKTVLDRVSYDPEFWNNFEPRKTALKKQ